MILTALRGGGLKRKFMHSRSFRDHGVYVGNQTASVAVEEFHITSEFFFTYLVILREHLIVWAGGPGLANLIIES